MKPTPVSEQIIPVYLNPAQLVAKQSTAAETFFIGGIGSGKTFFLAIKLWEALMRGAGVVCGLYAPTHKVLNNSTLSAIKTIWDGWGIRDGEHYVINCRAPKSWGIKSPYTGHDKILTTYKGSFCMMDGLENFNTVRGTQFDEYFIDEFRDVTHAREARETLLGRLRGEFYKSRGLKHRGWYVSSPPEDPTYMLEIKDGGGDVAFYFASSRQNRRNLPTGYVAGLETAYDERVYEREVLGMLVFINENRFAYKFDEAKHISDEAVYDPRREVCLSFDFNVSPLTATIWQTDRRTWAHCINEVKINNAEIRHAIDFIKTAYPGATFCLTGDATGSSRNLYGTRNLYDIIQDELGITRNNFDTPSVNPSLRASRIFLNSVLTHCDGIKIHPSCVHTIHDLRYVKVDKEGGVDKKDASLTHLLDTVRYFLHTYFSEAYDRKFLR